MILASDGSIHAVGKTTVSFISWKCSTKKIDKLLHWKLETVSGTWKYDLNPLLPCWNSLLSRRGNVQVWNAFRKYQHSRIQTLKIRNLIIFFLHLPLVPRWAVVVNVVLNRMHFWSLNAWRGGCTIWIRIFILLSWSLVSIRPLSYWHGYSFLKDIRWIATTRARMDPWLRSSWYQHSCMTNSLEERCNPATVFGTKWAEVWRYPCSLFQILNLR